MPGAALACVKELSRRAEPARPLCGPSSPCHPTPPPNLQLLETVLPVREQQIRLLQSEGSQPGGQAAAQQQRLTITELAASDSDASSMDVGLSPGGGGGSSSAAAVSGVYRYLTAPAPGDADDAAAPAGASVLAPERTLLVRGVRG